MHTFRRSVQISIIYNRILLYLINKFILYLMMNPFIPHTVRSVSLRLVQPHHPQPPSKPRAKRRLGIPEDHATIIGAGQNLRILRGEGDPRDLTRPWQGLSSWDLRIRNHQHVETHGDMMLEKYGKNLFHSGKTNPKDCLKILRQMGYEIF